MIEVVDSFRIVATNIRRAFGRGQRSRVIDANDLAEALYAVAAELNKMLAAQERARLRREREPQQAALARRSRSRCTRGPTRGLVSRWGGSSGGPFGRHVRPVARRANRNFYKTAERRLDSLLYVCTLIMSVLP
jgi:hypothetical protein